MIITPKSIGGFVRSLSGLFITKDNPNGITPKECSILAVLFVALNETEKKVITKDVKVQLANATNHSIQVITNYVNTLKQKGVITKENKLHRIFYEDKIIIEWNEYSAIRSSLKK